VSCCCCWPWSRGCCRRESLLFEIHHLLRCTHRTPSMSPTGHRVHDECVFTHVHIAESQQINTTNNDSPSSPRAHAPSAPLQREREQKSVRGRWMRDTRALCLSLSISLPAGERHINYIHRISPSGVVVR
jgi:hypothetical protein